MSTLETKTLSPTEAVALERQLLARGYLLRPDAQERDLRVNQFTRRPTTSNPHDFGGNAMVTVIICHS